MQKYCILGIFLTCLENYSIGQPDFHNKKKKIPKDTIKNFSS